MKTDTYYWFSTEDYTACGEYSTEKEAREDAEAYAALANAGHTWKYFVVKVVSESAPPVLTRKWKAA